jgi:Chaperone of endosialidase
MAVLILLAASQARAAETVPGNTCGTGNEVTNTWQWAGGKENNGVFNGMFCNGSTWAGVINFQSTGRVAIGNTAPGALLDIGKATSTLGTMRLEGSTSGYVQLQPAAAAGSWIMTLPPNAGTNNYVLTTNGSGVTSWAASSGGSPALSAITPATAANKINSAAYAQEWDWNSLSSGNGLTLGSTSLTGGAILYLSSKGTGAGNGQAGLWVTLSGANAGANKTTYAANVVNTHSGSGSTTVGLYASASGGAANYAAIFDQGNVGIGTTTPGAQVDVYNASGGGVQVSGPNSGFDIMTLGDLLAAPGNNGWNIRGNANSSPFDGNANSLGFEFWNGSTETQAVTLASNGYVGINQTTPGSALDVNGTVFVNDAIEHELNNNIEVKFYNEGGGNGFIGLGARSAGSPDLIVNQSGDVGIGTWTPVTALDVNGTIRFGYGGEPCDSSHVGGLYYSSATQLMYGCLTPPVWTAMGGGGAAVAFDGGTSETIGTAYAASTPGIVVAWATRSSGTCTLTGLTDGSNPPTTTVDKEASAQGSEIVAVTFPVKSGNHYKVTNSNCTAGGQFFTALTGGGGGGGIGGAAGNSGDVQFNNAGALDGSDSLFWDGSNLGIGTATPVADGTYQTLTLDGASGGEIFFNKAGTTEGSIWEDAGELGIQSITGEPIELYSNGGNVGTDGYIEVDQDGSDIGTDGSGVYHGISFGAGSGEAIGSDRHGASPNPYGLDFYTGWTKRMSVTNGGEVGIGTDAPDDNLTIVDSSGTSAEIDLDGYYVGRSDGGGAYLWDSVDESFFIGTDNGNGFVSIDDNGSVNAGQYTAVGGFIGTIYPSSDRQEFEYATPGGGSGSWYTEDEPTTNALFGISTADGNGVRVTPVLGRGDGWYPTIDVIDNGSGTASLVQSIYSGGSGNLGGWGARNAFVWGEKSYDPSPSTNYFENFYPLMVLTGDGGLGIGTVTPDDNLTIEDPDGSGSGAEMDISGLYIGRWNGYESYLSDSVAGESFNIYVNGNGDPSMTIDASGEVGIGTATPGSLLDVEGSTPGYSGINIVSYNNTGGINGPPFLQLYQARGSLASPSATQSGDVLMQLAGRGYGATGTNPNSTGDILATATQNFTDTAAGTRLDFLTTPNGSLTRVENMTIDQNGRVGIGTTSPGYTLDVNGEIHVGTLAAASGTSICRNGNVLSSCSSSIRYKENVKDAPFGLKDVMKMRPVTFKWKGRDENDLGFIAEEMAKVNPLFVSYEHGRIEGVKYPQLTSVLANAIKEQQAQIKQQQGEIDTLKALNDKLKAANDNIDARLKLLEAAAH